MLLTQLPEPLTDLRIKGGRCAQAEDQVHMRGVRYFYKDVGLIPRLAPIEVKDVFRIGEIVGTIGHDYGRQAYPGKIVRIGSLDVAAWALHIGEEGGKHATPLDIAPIAR